MRIIKNQNRIKIRLVTYLGQWNGLHWFYLNGEIVNGIQLQEGLKN